MKIRIPNLPPRWQVAFDRYLDWINVPIFHMKENDPNRSPLHQAEITIRRIDLVLVFFFFVCVGYYWLTAGWLWAIAGGLLYVMIAMCAMWFF